MKNSNIFTLHWKDAAKAFVVAVLTSFMTAMYTVINSDMALPTSHQWENIGMITLVASVSYIIKNFLTNSDDKFLTKDK